jgi:hypothetical protein
MIRRAAGATPPSSPTSGTLVAKVAAPGTSYTDAGLTASTTYSYALFAYSSTPYYSGGVGITAATAGSGPGPVTSLKVTTVTNTAVSLSWVNPAGATPPSSPTSGTLVTDTGPSATSFTDTGLSAGTQYSYALFAHDAVPDYAASAKKTAQTANAVDTTPPAVPTGLAIEARDGAVKVSWASNTEPDLAGYQVYYGTASGGPWTYAASTSPPTTSTVVSGLTNGVTYWFTVLAYDTSSNQSAKAAPVSATPDHVGGVSHCGTITASQTWTGGTTHALTCTVTVAPGVTLTIMPGAIVKGYSGAQLVIQGSLIADGTSSSPITFTDVRDDSVGGDYNGDGSATSPSVNYWYGINVTDTTSGVQPPSISLDYASLRYASLTVQNSGDDRDSTNYVARTTSITNSSFLHGASVNVSAVGPVVVTGGL